MLEAGEHRTRVLIQTHPRCNFCGEASADVHDRRAEKGLGHVPTEVLACDRCAPSIVSQEELREMQRRAVGGRV
jgi:hypothetical protein